MKITREMYRKALHFYLIHAYPNDDGQYYSHWAWLVSPKKDHFWKNGHYNDGQDVEGIPREIRFGCHVSGNTKLRVYPTGFFFDPNYGGDPEDVRKEILRIRELIWKDWDDAGLPVTGRFCKNCKHPVVKVNGYVYHRGEEDWSHDTKCHGDDYKDGKTEKCKCYDPEIMQGVL